MPPDHSSCSWHMRSDTGWRSPTLCAVCAYIWSGIRAPTAELRSATVSSAKAARSSDSAKVHLIQQSHYYSPSLIFLFPLFTELKHCS